MLRNDTKSFTATGPSGDFSLEDLKKAGLGFVERKFRPKETIFAPGDPDDQLYFLLSGVVRTYKIYDDHKEATTALIQNGGIFGELSLLKGRWQDVFAEAVTKASVASVQKASVERVVKSSPEFSLKLFSSFSERLRQSDELIGSLLHREVSARLATLLLSLADRFGVMSSQGIILDVRLTHQDLSNMVASTREAVSKVMSEFQYDNLIETSSQKITLIDQAALVEYAYGPSFYRN